MIDVYIEYPIDGSQRDILDIRHLALHEHLERHLNEFARVHLEFLAFDAVEAVQRVGVVELRRAWFNRRGFGGRRWVGLVFGRITFGITGRRSG